MHNVTHVQNRACLCTKLFTRIYCEEVVPATKAYQAGGHCMDTPVLQSDGDIVERE